VSVWGGAVRAEWVKTRTAGGAIWLLLAAAVLTVAVSTAVDAAAKCRTGIACTADPVKLSLTGVDLGQAVVAVVAVLAISNEYGAGMIRVTLAATPRRLAVLAAKAGIVTALTLVAGTVAVLACVLAGRLTLPANGFSYRLLSGPDLRAAAGSVLYLGLIALLSLGVATMIRDAAVGIGVVLALLYVFPIVVSVVGDPDLSRHLQQIGPMNAGLSIQDTVNLQSLPLSPWAGLGVLAAWAAGTLLAGGLLLKLRDA
jgi:ABC-2 type transport system permease protein